MPTTPTNHYGIYHYGIYHYGKVHLPRKPSAYSTYITHARTHEVGRMPKAFLHYKHLGTRHNFVAYVNKRIANMVAASQGDKGNVPEQRNNKGNAAEQRQRSGTNTWGQYRSRAAKRRINSCRHASSVGPSFARPLFFFGRHKRPIISFRHANPKSRVVPAKSNGDQ